jgi:RNA polymerase sigma factor (sigma-70 family)
MVMNQKRIRQRSRASTALAVVAFSFALAPHEIHAFLTGSSTSSRLSVHSGLPLHPSIRPELQVPSSHPLLMAKSSTQSSKSSSASNTRRLSREEERELLRDAHELKRLQQLEQDLALKSPSLDLPLLSVRAKAAGYGSDWEAYEDAKDRGHSARETLVSHNMGLVHYCVNDIIGTKASSKRKLNSLSREDLVQEGAIGLARAVAKYNPSLDTKFSTYAVYWIRAAIFRCIAERDDLMRVPEHVSAAIRKATAAAQRLGLDTNELSPLWREANAAKRLAEEAGLTDRQLNQAMQVKERRRMGGYVSFESWMQNGKDMASDVVTSGTSSTSSLDVNHIKQTLSRYLRPKEIEALSWRYGLNTSSQAAPKRLYRDYLSEAEEGIYGVSTSVSVEPVKGKWGEAMSFTEVGKQMSISAEYGRRLCHKALEKLKRAAEQGDLEPALLY